MRNKTTKSNGFVVVVFYIDKLKGSYLEIVFYFFGYIEWYFFYEMRSGISSSLSPTLLLRPPRAGATGSYHHILLGSSYSYLAKQVGNSMSIFQTFCPFRANFRWILILRKYSFHQMFTYYLFIFEILSYNCEDSDDIDADCGSWTAHSRVWPEGKPVCTQWETRMTSRGRRMSPW